LLRRSWLESGCGTQEEGEEDCGKPRNRLEDIIKRELTSEAESVEI
jgi:hypothetical protein